MKLFLRQFLVVQGFQVLFRVSVKTGPDLFRGAGRFRIAVGQLEISWNNKLFRIKGLIPMDSVNPTSFSRVQGVGVSAVIDVRV